MSLLEDVFLQDEAGEAQELERIIEGDEYDERPRSRSDSENNSEKEDEAEEDKRRVDPSSTKTKRVIKNPRFILNPARLTGPRGIQVIPDHFKDFNFKGKGHEREDLDLVLKKLEHWAYRLYPKFKFEDCLKKIETLGKKRPVMVHLHKIRSDQYLSEETVVQKDSSDEEPEKPPEDEFDKLLQQQIELARTTPAPGSVKKTMNSSVSENRPLIMPKVISSPSISDEQRERMLRNRKLAEERRLARLQNASNINESQNNEYHHETIVNNDNSNTEKMHMNVENTQGTVKRNKSNVINSSDDDEITSVNTSIVADVHTNINFNKLIEESQEVTINGEKKLNCNVENESMDVVSTNIVADSNKEALFDEILKVYNEIERSENNDIETIEDNAVNNEIDTETSKKVGQVFNNDNENITKGITNSISGFENVATEENDTTGNNEKINKSNDKAVPNKHDNFNGVDNETINGDSNILENIDNNKERTNDTLLENFSENDKETINNENILENNDINNKITVDSINNDDNIVINTECIDKLDKENEKVVSKDYETDQKEANDMTEDELMDVDFSNDF